MILINFFASFSIFGMEFCVELCVEKINIAISISGRKILLKKSGGFKLISIS